MPSMRICTECGEEFHDTLTGMSYFICEGCLIEME